MEYEGKEIKSFTDLNTWKEAHQLVLMIYFTTKKLPKEEIFGLVMQMRRAVISVTSNIAEGFSCNTLKDKIQFYVISHGSLTELQNQIIACKDIGYINVDDYNDLYNQSVTTHKLLTGLIASTKKREAR